MSIIRAIERDQSDQRKKVHDDYEARMKTAREKLALAKAAYQKAVQAFQHVADVAAVAHDQALKDIDVWGQDAKRAAQGVRRPRTLSDVAATVRKTQLHGAKVSLPRVACLDADVSLPGGA